MRPGELLIIVRKILPIIYILIGFGKPLILIPSIILLALELIPRFNKDLVLTILHFVVPMLLNNIYSIPLSAVLTMELHYFLRSNNAPWYYYALTFFSSSLISLFLLGIYAFAAYIIPTGYIVIYTLSSFLLFLITRFEFKADRELRTVAGGTIKYVLDISTKPRVRGIMKIKSPRSLTIIPTEVYIDGDARVTVTAHYSIGGVKKPRLTITLSDERRLVSVKRVVRHPSIAVVPRTQWAIEAAQKFMAALGPSGYVGDVTEAREYMPGDPIRRIYWKKALKLNKLVIKVLSQERGAVDLLILPYASNEVKKDIMGGLLVYLVTESIANGRNIRVLLLLRDGSLRNYVISRDNMWDGIKDVLTYMENLRVKYVNGVDQLGYFDDIKRAFRDYVRGLIGHGNLLIIGDRKWASFICNAYMDNCILI